MSANVKRTNIGMQTGIIGMILNVVMTIGKVGAGLVTGSQSLIADGINSLSDSLSSLITIFGFYIAAKPADKDHPYGHERSEYIAGFTMAIITLYLGMDVIIKAIGSVLEPASVSLTVLPIVIMVATLFIKVFLVVFYKKRAQAIDSNTLIAASIDAKSDILMTVSILLTLFVNQFTSLNLDAILGVFLGAYIIYNAIKMLLGFMNDLLGYRPSEPLLQLIKDILENNAAIFGYHDLLIHNYGKETAYGTVHVELEQTMSLIEAHTIIDQLEKEIYAQTNVHIVAHPDPLDLTDTKIATLYQIIKGFLKNNYAEATFHDMRLDNNILSFDIVLNGLTCEPEITQGIEQVLNEKGYRYTLNISYDIQQLI